ncbi:hypothetical protein BJ138DRAFT_1188317 [Hygrophoropsis aurantiaca]|uniref:Uncharacterized protein n=1 Tax=Hygrophoropsis aurantiaca TaxID=72124 RepID=A0ACB7ZRY1_9AGAM|nr:hypothetical protein BJ138DRAFT_1188317 [Hygrophoropsis aurantiaca]
MTILGIGMGSTHTHQKPIPTARGLTNNPFDANPPDFTTNEFEFERSQFRLAEEEERRLQQEQADAEEARKEHRKKNKAMYTNLCKQGPSKSPPIIPLSYASRKLTNGGLVELWYFTNEGINAANNAAVSGDTESEAMILVSGENGAQSWVKAGAVKDPKVRVKKDEELVLRYV